MSYKIAIASSDEVQVDLTFGGALEFLIYDVSDEGVYTLSEIRSVIDQSDGGCSGCGNPGAGGCGGNGEDSPRVNLLEDCRCIICKKIGFKAEKALQKKAVAGFAVDCSVTEALNKITMYFNKVDNHENLRGLQRRNYE
ncbi:MAG: NifB/NifX family molybdenum-iron cluster-binding protein [Lachnospiraceae bacterium]